jgi:transcriptional regulator with XRE-family HTH domain
LICNQQYHKAVFMVTFKQWAKQSGESHEGIAKMLGVSRPHITQIIAGKKRPSLKLIQQIILASNGKLKAEQLVNEFARI